MRPNHTAILAALVASAAAPSPGRAHVTLEAQQAVAGATYRAVFRVPYGCAGHAATTRLTVRLPEGVTGARPMPKPGWTLTIVPRPGEPAQAGHEAARGEAAAIVWEGGPLEDAHYDEFVIRLRLPEEPGLLYIPAVQDCAGGGRAAWDQVPEPGRRASDYPFIAPAVRLTPRN
jgi:periplasmic copper chaperone A